MWTQNGGGTRLWGNAANWSGGTRFPGANVGDSALFGSGLNAATTVTLDAVRKLSSLTINAVAPYEFAPGAGGSFDFVNIGAATVPVNVSGNVTHTISAPVTLDSSVVVTVSPSTTLDISGQITEGSAGQSLTKSGSGTLSLSYGNNAYSGATTIDGGVLAVSILANGLSSSSIGKSNSSPANLVLDGGTLQYAGGGSNTNRQFTLGAGGGTLDASGTGAVVFSNTGAIALASTGTRLLTLAGSNTGTNTLAASIADDAGGNATSVTKSGTGSWILSGASAYSGATLVSQGNLALNGSLLNSNVEVQLAATLSGNGTVANDVTLSGGTVNFASGGTIGGNLNVNAGGAWNGLGSVGTALVNTGTLAVNGTLLSLQRAGGATHRHAQRQRHGHQRRDPQRRHGQLR